MIDPQGYLLASLGNGARPYKFKVELSLPNDIVVSSILDSNKINTLCKSTQLPGVRVSQRVFWDNGHQYYLPSTKIYDTEWTSSFYIDDNFFVRTILEKWVALIDSYNGIKVNDISTNKNGMIEDAIDFLNSNSTVKKYSSTIQNAANSLTGEVIKGATSLVGSGIVGIAGVLEKNNINVSESATSKYWGDVSKIVDASVNKVEEYYHIKDEDVNFIDKSITNNGINIYGTIKITQLSITDDPIITYILEDAYPLSIQPIQYSDSSIDSLSEFTCSFSYSKYTIEKNTDNGLYQTIKEKLT